MSTKDESRLYDVRTLERNLRKGLVNKKDYEKYVKALPDAADKSRPVDPESQAREVAPREYRPRVTATIIAAPVDSDLEDIDDDEDLDDDLDDEDDDEDEAAEPVTEEKD